MRPVGSFYMKKKLPKPSAVAEVPVSVPVGFSLGRWYLLKNEMLVTNFKTSNPMQSTIGRITFFTWCRLTINFLQKTWIWQQFSFKPSGSKPMHDSWRRSWWCGSTDQQQHLEVCGLISIQGSLALVPCELLVRDVFGYNFQSKWWTLITFVFFGAMGAHVDDFHRIGDEWSPEWLEIK